MYVTDPLPSCVRDFFGDMASSESSQLPRTFTNTKDPQDKKKQEQQAFPGCNPFFLMLQNYPDQLPINPHRQICSSLTGAHVFHDNRQVHVKFHALRPFVLWTKTDL